MGTLESSIAALALEWGNPTAWSIHFDIKLFAAVYSVRKNSKYLKLLMPFLFVVLIKEKKKKKKKLLGN
jgi:hypothetical protein